ncbi:MAG: GNAT family N-acetyltransferase [Alicyclobacillus sp.]|nr:GNAT family N-acetyltransferase [Alicyclobacillus sp.]
MEVRLLSAEEYEAAVRLADEVFRDAEQKSMGTAFPFVFSPQLGQGFGAFEGGRLVSFMGLVPSVIRIGPARLPVYSLGSVCTAPDARGKGYASALLEQVQRHVDRAGAALMLVSGDRSLYTRNRCHRFGAARRFTLDPAFAGRYLSANAEGDPGRKAHSQAPVAAGGSDGGVSVRIAGPLDWLAMEDLARRRYTAFEQGVLDLAQLVHAEAYASCLKLSHQVLVAESGGQAVAFLVYGVPYRPGLPRDPMAVEWAGDAAVVARLMAEAVRRHGFERFHVRVPWQDLCLQRELAAAESRPEANQGTVFIPSAERLFRHLRPFLAERDPDLAAALHVRDLPDGGCELRLGSSAVCLDSAALTAFVFDEQPASPGGEWEAVRRRLFPLPFPYTVGLNYV